MATSDTIWILNFRGVLLEVAVSPEGFVTRADAPMEWSIGEAWLPVFTLFESIGHLSKREP
jgi:hypothetical protein